MSKGTTSVRDTMRLALLAEILTIASCKPAPSPYDKLCTIYQNYDSQTDESLDWMALSQRIANEAPEVAEDHNNILLNQTGSRYELFRKRARESWKQSDWQCEAIRKRWPPQ